MNLNSTFTNSQFKNRREEINNIKSLTENNMPILPNKRKLILSAIDDIGKSTDKRDIEMLMGTVESMKYGIQNNSQFAKALSGGNGEKENTDWDGILQSTIRNAIDSANIEDKSQLEARFQKIFGEEKPLTEEEKTMLELRQSILSSKEMTNVLADSEKTIEAARVTQNLDYFIASSEINTEDKIKCLKMMNHFLSDEYEIHPQLKEHKVQAFSEMVNDLIIKRPDEEVYTIKDVSQKQTGMCAAISIARKTIAYEDKVRAMEIMMAELDNKPTMEVYDRTQIGTGKKVEIQKAHVDFADGMKKGYRIIDTGTHQWMNAADTVGDGTIAIGHYQAFDPDNYEIFRDAHWKNDLPQEYKPAQNWLRYLQKEEKAVGNAVKRNLNIAKVQKEIGQYKKDFETDIVKSNAAIREIIKSIDPTVTDSKAVNLTRQILKADKSEKKEFKLTEGEPKELRNQKLAAMIKSELPNVEEGKLKENIERIGGFREISVQADENLSRLKAHSTPQAIFSYNKNLFTAAAHHRRSVQAELDVPERLLAYEKHLNIPTRENNIQEASQRVLSNLTSKSLVDKMAESFGVEADKNSVKMAVEKAVIESEIEIPSKLDDILSQMGMGDRVNVAKSFLSEAENKINAGDTETLQTYAENAHIKPDAALVLKKINNVKSMLDNNPSNRQIAEAVSLLGYNNQIEMTADMYKTYSKATEKDIESKDIDALGKQIKSLSDKQSQIERQLGIPDRKDIVLNVLEATGDVLPAKTLQEMQAKFDKVAEVKSENDNRIVDPSVKKPKIPDSMYKFTPEEKEIYAKIESKLPQMKTYAKVNAKEMKAALAPQLDELYAEAGRLDGHLWSAPEGSSGLYDNQSIKVLEMITGKHYYNESDIDKVVEHIKKGEGSGTSSTNVDHTSYSGHAQYVEEVSQVEVIDAETKERVLKDVLWHDNTWGRAEDRTVWTDANGVQRTDYGNGYGGPDGYVFDKRLLTGTFVDDQKTIPGILDNGQKFDLWKSTRIQGEDPSAEEKINEVMTDIVQLGNAEAKIGEYEKLFKKSPKVDFDLMDHIDKTIVDAEDKLISKIEKSNIKTQSDIDKLEDKKLKFLLEKTAIEMSLPSDEAANILKNITEEEDLAAIKSKLPKIQKNIIGQTFLKGKNAPKVILEKSANEIASVLGDILAKSGETDKAVQLVKALADIPKKDLDGSVSTLKNVMIENAVQRIGEIVEDKDSANQLSKEVTEIISSAVDDSMIKSAKDLKSNSKMADVIIRYADKKFNTTSDADLDAALQKIQNMTNKEFNEFMSDASNADLGIKDVDALSVAKQINAQKDTATKIFTKNARMDVILTSGLDMNKAPEWYYRSLKQNFAPLNNTIDINNMKKSSVLEKQGLYAAFPETEIMSEGDISSQVSDFLKSVKDVAADIKTSDNKAEDAAMLNNDIREYVSANIVEKNQSKAIGFINSYIKSIKNNSEFSDEIYNATESMLSQSHISKNPNELIKMYIREVQSDNKNEDKLNVLRNYMVQAMTASDISNVEYDLISNSLNGFDTMTKSSFDNFTLNTSDGREISLDSDEGTLFLVDQLANPANGSSALQVFLVQTGLSDKAVDVISQKTNLELIPNVCSKLADELSVSYSQIKDLDSKFAKFTEEKAISYSSYKDAVSHFIKNLEKDSADFKEKKIFKAYKTFLQKTQNADFVKNISSEQILPVLEKLHEKAVSSLNSGLDKQAAQLYDMYNTVDNRLSAMEAVRLAQNSEKASEKESFINSAKDVKSKLEEYINKINEASA